MRTSYAIDLTNQQAVRHDCHIITLEEIMRRFYPEMWIRLTRTTGGLEGVYTSQPSPFRFIIDLAYWMFHREKGYEKRQKDCEEMAAYLKKDMELPMSAMKFTEWTLELCRPRRHLSSLVRLSTEFIDRLKDEMSLRAYYSVTPREAQYYNSPWDGWKEIVSRFNDATDDIEELSKCFALSRYPACVYHSLQVTEIGIIELGRFIGVKDPKPGWDATKNELKRILAKKYDQRNAFEQAHSAFMEQINATIEALQTAWRNKISHTEGRLVLVGKEFSADVAEEIMLATRAFMRRLAEELPKP